MVKKRRQRPLPVPPRPRRRPWSREFRLQLAAVGAFGVLLAIIVVIIGYAFFQDWYEEHVERPHSKAVQVGETSFDLDYFARRLRLLVGQFGWQGQTDLAGTAAQVMVNALQEEELLRSRAGFDLGVSVSPEEVDGEIAAVLNVSQDDPQAFQAAYEAERRRADLSDEEYRAKTEADILRRKVQEVFSLSVPDTIEQVRVRQILVGTEEEALAVVERLDAGEDFADLARELSLDEDTKEEGGERGWLARDEDLELSYSLRVFALAVGAPSEPIPAPEGYFIYEVAERQADREVTPEQRSRISSNYFSLWLNEQRTLLPPEEYLSSDPDNLQWATERAFGL